MNINLYIFIISILFIIGVSFYFIWRYNRMKRNYHITILVKKRTLVKFKYEVEYNYIKATTKEPMSYFNNLIEREESRRESDTSSVFYEYFLIHSFKH